MKIATKKVYECEHCGKLSYNAGAMSNHEARCKKNPSNIPLCWKCKHKDWEPGKITITYERHTFGGYFEGQMSVENHSCDKRGCKLYSILTSQRKIDDLENHGFEMMPSLTKGCADFEEAKQDANEIPFL